MPCHHAVSLARRFRSPEHCHDAGIQDTEMLEGHSNGAHHSAFSWSQLAREGQGSSIKVYLPSCSFKLYSIERLSAVESCKSNAKMRQEVSMALVLVLNMQCTNLCNSYFLNEPIFAFLRRCLWRQEVVPNSDDTSGLRLFLAIPLLVYASAGCFHVHWHPCDGQLTARFCAGFDRQFRRQAW